MQKKDIYHNYYKNNFKIITIFLLFILLTSANCGRKSNPMSPSNSENESNFEK